VLDCQACCGGIHRDDDCNTVTHAGWLGTQVSASVIGPVFIVGIGDSRK
jgi:hypothetical protein